MENNIPRRLTGRSGPVRSPETAGSPPAHPGGIGAGNPAGSALGNAVDRSLERRRAAAQDEVERLVAAAFRVIERTGDLEPKVSDILAEAGLSNQAFYRHFRSKHELLVTVLDEGIRGLADYLAQRMAESSDPADPDPDPALAIREWVRGMAAQARIPSGARASRPFALARGRLAEAFPSEVAESARQITAPLRDALERAREAGVMPAVVPPVDAEALYHLMMGWVEARLVEGRTPEAREVDRLEAFILGGLERDTTERALGGASVAREDTRARTAAGHDPSRPIGEEDQ